ncbi:MAG: hypothetical protein LBC92_04960 [Rickettsiales bacterium]|jgi:hypothetical protein|nr:hypothetical protein [Rickettsiales bacterium]
MSKVDDIYNSIMSFIHSDSSGATRNDTPRSAIKKNSHSDNNITEANESRRKISDDELLKNLMKDDLEDKIAIIEDEAKDIEKANEEDDEEGDDDGFLNLSDEEKKLREMVKLLLSDNTVNVINNDKVTVEEVIEKLKSLGISNEKAKEMVKMKTVNKTNSKSL